MPTLIEVNEPLELQNHIPIYFKAKEGTHTRFYFKVDELCVIKVKTWPLDKDSEPDLYMTIDEPDVSNEKYHFKSNRIGADEIIVYSDNPKFKLGVYHIAIEAFMGS